MEILGNAVVGEGILHLEEAAEIGRSGDAFSSEDVTRSKFDFRTGLWELEYMTEWGVFDTRHVGPEGDVNESICSLPEA